MDFGGAAVADDLDEGAGGVAAHDGVVDEDDALAFQVAGERIVFEGDTYFAQLIVGLDEGAADVAIFGQSFGVGDAGFQAVADGMGCGGVWHTDDDVGLGRGFLRQDAPHLLAYLVNGLPWKVGIGAGEVDVFKDAEGAFFLVDAGE